MQAATDFLFALYRRGMKVSLDDGRLRIQGATGGLLPQELETLRSMKAQIIGLLADRELDLQAPLTQRDLDAQIPLTAIQLRYWHMCTQQEKSFGRRACIVARRIAGALNVELLCRAWDTVVQRHESLRTRIVVVDGVPRQQVDVVRGLELTTIDLSDVGADDWDEEVARRVRAISDEKIDLSVGPLVVANIFRRAALEHVLVLALDHMITDESSMRILEKEIWTLYQQGLRGLPFSLPAMPVQFADYAIWQQRTYGDWLERHGAYWVQRLAGAPKVQIPDQAVVATAEQGATAEHGLATVLRIPFGVELSDALTRLAQREGTLLSIVVLTIHVATMAHWCQGNDMVMSFASNGRFRPELENVTGFVTSILNLRIDISAQDSFLGLLRKIEQEFCSACEHLDYDRVPDLIPGCRLNLDLYFNWTQDTPDSALDDAAMPRIEPFQFMPNWSTKFFPFFRNTTAGITANVLYRPDIIRPQAVERFARNLRLFASSFVQDPSAGVMRPVERFAAIGMQSEPVHLSLKGAPTTAA